MSLHLRRNRERERADAVAITNAGPFLGLELIQRSLEAVGGDSIERVSQARIHQDLRRPPGAGLLAVLRTQTEVGRREHEADREPRVRGGPRRPPAEQCRACEDTEFAPGHAHGLSAAFRVTCVQSYSS